MCLATLNSKLITARDVPNTNIPIYQYDSILEIKMLLLKTEVDLRKHGLIILEVLMIEVVLSLKKHLMHGINL